MRGLIADSERAFKQKRSRERAEAVSRCRAQMEEIGVGASLFMLDCGTAPESPRELLTNVSARIGWRGPYLRAESSMTDPWGREFAIASQPGPAGRVFIVSRGGRASDTNDDLIIGPAPD